MRGIMCEITPNVTGVAEIMIYSVYKITLMRVYDRVKNNKCEKPGCSHLSVSLTRILTFSVLCLDVYNTTRSFIVKC